MTNPRVLVITSDRYLWAMQPFSYLFNTFWSSQQPVTVAGYSFPNFSLPSNFTFLQVSTKEVPAENWTDSFSAVLGMIPDDFVTILFEDYWICRGVDARGIATLCDYMYEVPNVLRMDLSTDVLYANGSAGNATPFDHYGHYDIIEKSPGKEYRMSLQAGIWNRRMLLSIIREGEMPWEVETGTIVPVDWYVLGTRQWPLRYINAIDKGKINMGEINKIPEPYLTNSRRFIPHGWRVDVPNSRYR